MKDTFKNSIKPNLRRLLENNNIDKLAQDLLMTKSYSIELEKGDIFLPNFDSSALCFIDRGMLRLEVEYPGERILNSGFFMPKTIITALTKGSEATKANTTFTSILPCCLTVIPGPHIHHAIRHHSDLFEFVFNIESMNIGFIHDWVLLQKSLDKKQRVIQFLALAFLYLTEEDIDQAPFTYEDISSLCGISRQFCSQIIHELCLKRILTKSYGSIWLNDLDGLIALSDIQLVTHYKKYLYSTSITRQS